MLLGRPPTRPTSLSVSTLAQATTWRTGSIDSAPPEREWWQRACAKDREVIQFPYAEGAFRDTFVWQAETGSWSLWLESQAKDGTWSTFANYALTRPKKAT